MAKYIIRYIDKEGDTSKCWVEASSEKEAITEAKREYWDIESIVSVTKM